MSQLLPDTIEGTTWAAPDVYDTIASILHAKAQSDASRDSHGEPRQPLAEFVPAFFEAVYGSRVLSKDRLNRFLRGLMGGVQHAAFGGRLRLFGLLCGTVAYEQDDAGLAAHPHACDDCDRAVPHQSIKAMDS